MTIDEQKKFVEMQEDLSTVKSDVKDIKNALLGDGYISNGLIGELKKQEETIKEQGVRLSNLEDAKKRMIYLAIGAGAGGIMGLKTLFDFVMRVITKS